MLSILKATNTFLSAFQAIHTSQTPDSQHLLVGSSSTSGLNTSFDDRQRDSEHYNHLSKANTKALF